MKILKNHILCLGALFLLVATNLEAQGIFYSNANIECSGLMIKLEQCVGVSDDIKVKAVFNNLTDHYIVINPEDILISTPLQYNTRASRRRPIVIRPKDVIRITLVFPRIEGMKESPINLSFSKIGFSGNLINSFKAEIVDPKTGLIVLESPKLNLKVLESIPGKKDYGINMLVSYDRKNFLVIDYHKAFFSTANGKFYNTHKSAFCFDNQGASQRMRMIFSYSEGKGVRIKGNIDLSEVFKEYAVTIKTGCDTPLKLISEKDFLLQKTGTEEVIDEIE